MRGRKPKPTFLKLVTGNPGHRPLNQDEPEPDGELLEPPTTFSARQRIAWQETLKNAPEGMLRKLDIGVVASYVVNLCLFLDASEKVAELGQMVKQNGVACINPYISIARNANAAMVKAASELGFTPSSRSRVKVTGKKKAKNAFGRLKELGI
jgi:P27 family predicted phage terminase small subunit